jgi:hypothetical protein
MSSCQQRSIGHYQKPIKSHSDSAGKPFRHEANLELRTSYLITIGQSHTAIAISEDQDNLADAMLARFSKLLRSGDREHALWQGPQLVSINASCSGNGRVCRCLGSVLNLDMFLHVDVEARPSLEQWTALFRKMRRFFGQQFLRDNGINFFKFALDEWSLRVHHPVCILVLTAGGSTPSGLHSGAHARFVPPFLAVNSGESP